MRQINMDYLSTRPNISVHSNKGTLVVILYDSKVLKQANRIFGTIGKFITTGVAKIGSLLPI